ncbi:MAG: PAS-domain containing protein [Pseudomonadota bacterium]
MSPWTVGAALGLYAAALFAVGWWSQRRTAPSRGEEGIVAALSIGIYCTSWTFYGAVGTAFRSGWDYLPIYLGPILVFLFGRGLIRKTVALGKAHGATSLPDLLSRRFGRSGRLAALVTLTAVIVSIPYIALQLIAVASTFAEVTGSATTRPAALVLTVAAVLGGFGIFFGLRTKDMAEANPGLVGAIAFDSVFKLVAFAAVAILAMAVVSGERPALISVEPSFGGSSADRFIVLTILSGFAIFCLPRQFHVMVVEARSASQMERASPWVAAYLAIFAILVLPVSAAGRLATPSASPDLFVLSLPESMGLWALELFAFTGGFAAAAGMIIVAGIALSTMVASDLVLPLLVKTDGERALSQVLLLRRLTLAVLLLLSSVFALMVPVSASLAELGVVSFAGAAQFAPLLLAALYFPRASERGAEAGLVAGGISWLLLVLSPAFFEGQLLDWSPLSQALLPALSDDFTRGAVLALVINIGVLISVSLLTPISLRAREEAARFAAMSPSLPNGGSVRLADLKALLVQILGEADTDQMLATFSPLKDRDMAPPRLVAAAETKLSRVLGNASANILLSRLLSNGRIEAGDVMILMGDATRELRFGQELLSTTLENLAEGVSVIDAEGRLVAWNKAYAELFGYPDDLLSVGLPVEELFRHNLPHLTPDQIVRRRARLLGGRPHNYETRLRDGRVVRLQGRPVPGGGYVTSFSDVTEYREAQAALKASEQATRFYTDNVPFPIAYSDHQERIRFHNKSYAAMVGRPGEDVAGATLPELFGPLYACREPAIRSVLRGESGRFVLSPDDIGGAVTWQVTYVPQLGSDGRVVGFFGFYQDISKRRAAQAALEEANRTLERRVDQRTSELQHANHEIDLARREAIAANQSKTRFLAAASHDVLQPLNAARLFASSLEDDLRPSSAQAETARKIGAAIVSADTLLRSLLNLSRLEAGGVDPKMKTLRLRPFLQSIADEFRPSAEEKGLSLSVVETSLCITTDPGLLRSALQNLVSNAVRYTDKGGIVLGARRRGTQVSVEVIDTGRGIDSDELPTIFEEFTRLRRDSDVDGVGLGLATVKRVAELMAHEIAVSSIPQRGTVFRLLAARADEQTTVMATLPKAASSLAGANIVCVDNDPAVLEALKMRFERWGAHTDVYANMSSIKKDYANGTALPDLLILDYQLDDGATGLDVLDFMRDEKGADCPAIVITASRSPEVDALVAAKGVNILAKPVEPAALRALSVSLLNAQSALH